MTTSLPTAMQHYITCGFSSCPNTTKVVVISFDVMKAFDQVLKNKLLMVLRRDFRVPDRLAAIVDSYLTDRKQTVIIGGEQSDDVIATSGVAQGSILGPHLFNAFIQSVLNLNLSFGSKLIAFADDLLLIKPIRNDDDSADLQSDIDMVHRQYSDLCLTLNPQKTTYLLSSIAPNPTNLQLSVQPTLNGEAINRTSSLKYLGVMIDQKLSFGLHAETQAMKAKKAIGALWRTLGRWTSREHFKEIYSKQILPILTYAIPVACPSTRKHWETSRTSA